MTFTSRMNHSKRLQMKVTRNRWITRKNIEGKIDHAECFEDNLKDVLSS